MVKEVIPTLVSAVAVRVTGLVIALSLLVEESAVVTVVVTAVVIVVVVVIAEAGDVLLLAEAARALAPDPLGEGAGAREGPGDPLVIGPLVIGPLAIVLPNVITIGRERGPDPGAPSKRDQGADPILDPARIAHHPLWRNALALHLLLILLRGRKNERMSMITETAMPEIRRITLLMPQRTLTRDGMIKLPPRPISSLH